MRYFLIAGEASGDLHASNLMREILKVDHKAKFCFLGGDLMQAVGGTMIKHYRDMAFMGFWAVFKNLKTILANIELCKAAIDDFKPDKLILIDYPGFNLRIAKHVKTTSKLPIHYYIPPKIWAWKEYRIKDIKKYIDRVYTIFPFETEFYERHKYQVEYVGNPTVDSIANRPLQNQSFEAFCTKNNLTPKPMLALLAGSRKQEIAACLPRMLKAAMQFDGYQVVVARAPGIDADFYAEILKSNRVPVIFGQTYELVHHASAAVVNSGTATLETALIGTPQVVVYYVMFGRLAYWAKNVVLKIKYISLVNLISERETVKELIAHKFTVKNVQTEIDMLLNDKAYKARMLTDYEDIKTKLGEPGTARKAALLLVKIETEINNS
jgi:lipid-A-disaccharide synthase